jgi:hypothetical protein
MSVRQEQKWISGADFGEERRRLIRAGFRDDSPELDKLWGRVRERDDYLWDRYARPLMASHKDEWIAISPEGEVLLGRTASIVMHEATEKFGAGNYSFGKLADFPGHDLSRC